MTRDEMIKRFEGFDYKYDFSDIGLLVFENLMLKADLFALKKYVARQFLNLNTEVLDEPTDELLRQHDIIDKYSDEYFQILFTEYVQQRGEANTTSEIDDSGKLI